MESNKSNKNLEDFIQQLSADLKPVKKLPPIKWRLLWPILSSIVIIPLLMKVYSSLSLADFHWNLLKVDLLFLIQVILMLATWVSTLAVAFLSIIPGRYKSSYLWVPGTLLILLIISILSYYISPEHIVLEHRSVCMVEISLLAVIPFYIMLNMLKKGFFISENVSLFLGALSSALFPTLIMQFTCSTHPTHVLLFHFIPLFLFAFLIPKIYLKFFHKPM
jgi:hypothetical protein